MKVSVPILYSLVATSFCQLVSSEESRDGTLSRNDTINLNSCKKVYYEKPEHQCEFALEHCASSDQIGRINYLRLYYCESRFLGKLSILPLIAFLCIFFVSLGLTASDYLCPNLYTISKYLNLSDNIAGLTLLAMGNGSPDVLSTYSAMSARSGSMAVSELFGASLFITSIVIGSMSMIKPFKVPAKSFLRDGTFLLVVILLFFFTLLDSKISTSDCIILLGAYGFYVTASVLSHSYLTFIAKKKLRNERSRSRYSMGLTNEDNAVRRTETNDIYLDSFTNLPTIEELNLENHYDEDEEDLINEEYSTFLRTQSSAHTQGIPVETGSYGLKLLLKELGKHSRLEGHVKLETRRPLTAPVMSQSIQLYDENQPAQTSPSLTSQAFENNSNSLNESSLDENPDSTNRSDSNLSDDEENFGFSALYKTRTLGIRRLFSESNSKILLLLFPSMIDFSELSLVSKIRVVSLLPVSIFLRITSPVRDQTIISYLKQIQKRTSVPFHENDADDYSEDSLEFDFETDKSLLKLQWAGGIIFMNYVLFGEKRSFLSLYLPMSLSFSTMVYFAFNTFYSIDKVTSKSIRYVSIMNFSSSLLGFSVSISWISIFATEIVSVLKSIATIFNLSDDLLGVTVFALGNSVGDLISNFTIAKMGMPMMAFGACFGGPLLSICSIGFVGLLVTSEGLQDGYEIELSAALITTALMSAWNVLVLIVLVYLNDWTVDRRIGGILIFNWCLSTFLCITYELNG